MREGALSPHSPKLVCWARFSTTPPSRRSFVWLARGSTRRSSIFLISYQKFQLPPSRRVASSKHIEELSYSSFLTARLRYASGWIPLSSPLAKYILLPRNGTKPRAGSAAPIHLRRGVICALWSKGGGILFPTDLYG